MVLLHAMAAHRLEEIAGIATFDHGTGRAATAACELVVREASALGLRVLRGSAPAGLESSEAAWREARWAFLCEAAQTLGARVVTAHTRDDQIETVMLRLLRGAGPRGLAGMLASDASSLAPSGSPLRPLLSVPRAAVVAYAEAHGVAFIEDPSNATLSFQRNRVRHEILPACERATPGFGDWCWAISVRAADWRAEVEALITGLGVHAIDRTTVIVPLAAVEGIEVAGWELIWPAIAARAGVVMDRRGVVRAARWAPSAQVGQEIPLSGGARLARTRTTFVVHGPRQGTVLRSQDYIP
jgi:tRNA(Ile)-lysidine synthase